MTNEIKIRETSEDDKALVSWAALLNEAVTKAALPRGLRWSFLGKGVGDFRPGCFPVAAAEIARRAAIERTIQECGGNLECAAAKLGITTRHLRRLRRILGQSDARRRVRRQTLRTFGNTSRTSVLQPFPRACFHFPRACCGGRLTCKQIHDAAAKRRCHGASIPEQKTQGPASRLSGPGSRSRDISFRPEQ